MRSLIIYATKYGCVEKAANMLKSKMNGEVFLVNITEEKVPSLDDFDNVILGGSIYIGKIQKTLTNYIKSNLPFLLHKRIGLFICAGESEPVRTKELAEAFPAELFNHAAAKEVFGHELCYEKLNVLDKLIMRSIKGVTKSSSDLSEQKIENFAKTINEHTNLTY
ncbi:MAG: flavodoxin domain-containing protein [Paludibacter sp.]